MENTKIQSALQNYHRAQAEANHRKASGGDQVSKWDLAFAFGKGGIRGLEDGLKEMVQDLGSAAISMGATLAEEGLKLYANPGGYINDKTEALGRASKQAYEFGKSTYRRFEQDPKKFLQDIGDGVQRLEKAAINWGTDLAAGAINMAADFSRAEGVEQAEKLGYATGRVVAEAAPALLSSGGINLLAKGSKLIRLKKLGKVGRWLDQGTKALAPKLKAFSKKALKTFDQVEKVASYLQDFSGQVGQAIKSKVLKMLPDSFGKFLDFSDKIKSFTQAYQEAPKASASKDKKPALAVGI